MCRRRYGHFIFLRPGGFCNDPFIVIGVSLFKANLLSFVNFRALDELNSKQAEYEATIENQEKEVAELEENIKTSKGLFDEIKEQSFIVKEAVLDRKNEIRSVQANQKRQTTALSQLEDDAIRGEAEKMKLKIEDQSDKMAAIEKQVKDAKEVQGKLETELIEVTKKESLSNKENEQIRLDMEQLAQQETDQEQSCRLQNSKYLACVKTVGSEKNKMTIYLPTHNPRT